jgi:hypothetical protein
MDGDNGRRNKPGNGIHRCNGGSKIHGHRLLKQENHSAKPKTGLPANFDLLGLFRQRDWNKKGSPVKLYKCKDA